MFKKISTIIFTILLSFTYKFILSFTTTLIVCMNLLDTLTRGIEVGDDYATTYLIENSNTIGLLGILSIILFISFMFYVKQVKFKHYLHFRIIDLKLILRLICYSIIIQEISIKSNEFLNYFISLDDSMQVMRNATTSDNFMFTLTIVGILAPMVEEVYFRGIVFTKLKNKINLKSAIILQALLFASIHMNPAQFISCFILGCISAILYLKYDSMIAPITLHVSFNSIAVVLVNIGESSNTAYNLLLAISIIYLSYNCYKTIRSNHKIDFQSI